MRDEALDTPNSAAFLKIPPRIGIDRLGVREHGRQRRDIHLTLDKPSRRVLPLDTRPNQMIPILRTIPESGNQGMKRSPERLGDDEREQADDLRGLRLNHGQGMTQARNRRPIRYETGRGIPHDTQEGIRMVLVYVPIAQAYREHGNLYHHAEMARRRPRGRNPRQRTRQMGSREDSRAGRRMKEFLAEQVLRMIP